MIDWDEQYERYEDDYYDLLRSVDTGWDNAENHFFDEVADNHSIKDIYELVDREPEIREKLTKLLHERYRDGFKWDEDYWLNWFFGHEFSSGKITKNWFPQPKEDGSICIEVKYGRNLQFCETYEYRDLNHWMEEEYELGESPAMPYFAWWYFREK